MGDVQFPFALNEQGSVVDASKVPRDGKFFCVDCAAEMVLRRGEVKAPHFGHKSEAADGGCSNESVLHKAAKLRIQEHLLGGGVIEVPKTCAGCRREELLNIQGAPKLEYASTENTRVDVAVLDPVERPVLFVEVLVTHEVDNKKASELNSTHVPWVESKAFHILEDPSLLVPNKHSQNLLFKCDSCKKKEEERKLAEAKAEAERKAAQAKAQEERRRQAEEAERIAKAEAERKAYIHEWMRKAHVAVEAAEKKRAEAKAIQDKKDAEARAAQAKIDEAAKAAQAKMDAVASAQRSKESYVNRIVQYYAAVPYGNSIRESLLREGFDPEPWFDKLPDQAKSIWWGASAFLEFEHNVNIEEARARAKRLVEKFFGSSDTRVGA